MKLFLLGFLATLIMLPNCGPYKVEVSPTSPIEIVHKIDLSMLEKYFAVICSTQENQEIYGSQEKCQEAKLGEFITIAGEVAQ